VTYVVIAAILGLVAFEVRDALAERRARKARESDMRRRLLDAAQLDTPRSFDLLAQRVDADAEKRRGPR